VSGADTTGNESSRLQLSEPSTADVNSEEAGKAIDKAPSIPQIEGSEAQQYIRRSYMGTPVEREKMRIWAVSEIPNTDVGGSVLSDVV